MVVVVVVGVVVVVVVAVVVAVVVVVVVVMVVVMVVVVVGLVLVGGRAPRDGGGARGALGLVGRGMLVLRCGHKAGRRDGRGSVLPVQ